MSKVITAPVAIIKIGGVAIGKMRNIRLTENLNRGTVYGLGALTPDEVPALQWSGTLTCGMYLIDFSKSMNKLINGTFLQRRVQSLDEFVDTILLEENGVQVDIMRKVAAGAPDPNTGIITPQLEIFASIKGAFNTREGMDISENQIGGRDADFVYTTPVIYSV